MVHDTLMNDTLSTMTLRQKFLSNTSSSKSHIVEYDTLSNFYRACRCHAMLDVLIMWPSHELGNFSFKAFSTP